MCRSIIYIVWALLSGGKPLFSGPLCSAGTALTRAHTYTIRRFCGAKEKEPRAIRLGSPRCDWPNRYAHLTHVVARSPLPGAPGYGARARSSAENEFTDPLGRKAHDVATRGAQVAALQLRRLKEAAKR